MKQLFNSATVRLTGWYILILACISLLFSVLLYQASVGELERRLRSYQRQSRELQIPMPEKSPYDALRLSEVNEGKASLIGILVYMNIIILTAGGALSYLLARITLRPVEAAHEAQARFVSDASHELRTPLTTMTTELEVALSDPSLTTEEMQDILSSNLEEVKRLSALSTMLLTLSTNNHQTLPQKPFALTLSLKRTIARLQTSPSRLSLIVPKNSLRAIGNQAAIEELITILVDNALKYSDPASEIRVSVTARDHHAAIMVTNTGEGIPKEHLSRIFERFYRIDEARHDDGYGLGLALARQISDTHGAELSVTSTPQKQTCFTFSLPLVKKKQRTPSRRTAKKA